MHACQVIYKPKSSAQRWFCNCHATCGFSLDKVVCTSQSSKETDIKQAFGPTSLGEQSYAIPISEVVTKAEAGGGMTPGETAGLWLFEEALGRLNLRTPCAMTGYWY